MSLHLSYRLLTKSKHLPPIKQIKDAMKFPMLQQTVIIAKVPANEHFYLRVRLKSIVTLSSGFRGADPPPLRDSTPCRPKGSPLCTILRYPFLVTDPENFLKTPLAPIYTDFEGERAKKNAIFWSTFSKKCLKTPFLTFFSEICLRRRKYFCHIRVFIGI